MTFAKMLGGTAVLILTTSIGCASNQTIGDKMKDHGKLTRDIGNQWNQGDSMVKKGNKLRNESDELARKSREKQAESEKLLTEGRQLMQKSEVAYQSQFGTSMR